MIPKLLRQRPQWVLWRLEQRNGSKPTKIPYQGENPSAKASTTNSSTWCSYEQAVVMSREKGFDGVGFVFSDDDPYYGIDFDNACNMAGEINSEALKYINGIESTYIEYSPSGYGLHAIVLGSLGSLNRHKIANAPWGGGLEMYETGRYFCMTGDRLETSSSLIRPIDAGALRGLLSGSNGDSSVPSVSQYKPESRHDELIATGADLMRSGTPREVVEGVLRAKANVIGLPDREEDEVGRIINWLYQATSLDNRIARAEEQMYVQDAARINHNAKKLGHDIAQAEQTVNLAEELEKPEVPINWVIQDLFEFNTNATLFATRKIGKSTLIMNMVKSLVDGTPFLGNFAVTPPPGNVMYLNYELTSAMLTRWYRKLDLDHPERLYAKNLRGKSLPFWLDSVKAELAAELKEKNIWLLIVDPQSMSQRGFVESENDNTAIIDWQMHLAEVMELAGVPNCITVHHIGKSSTTSGRGGSQYEAWPDYLWYFERADGMDLNMRLFNAAEGRAEEEDVPPMLLKFDKPTLTYTWDGATSHEGREDNALVLWLQTLISMKSTNENGKWPLKSDAIRCMGNGCGGAGKNVARAAYIDSMCKQGFVKKLGSATEGGGKSIHIMVTDAGQAKANRSI